MEEVIGLKNIMQRYGVARSTIWRWRERGMPHTMRKNEFGVSYIVIEDAQKTDEWVEKQKERRPE